MGTLQVDAYSARLPVEEMLAHPEGGAEAAAQAAQRIFGTSWVPVGAARWFDSTEPGEDDLLISTYGSAAVILNAPGSVSAPDADRYSVGFESVSMSVSIEVHSGAYQRDVALDPGSLDLDEGSPLPFEEPFWAGEYDDPEMAEFPVRFDVEEYGEAATQWMFGCSFIDPQDDDRVDITAQPLHVLRAAAPGPGAATARTAPRDAAPRRSWLDRLLGR